MADAKRIVEDYYRHVIAHQFDEVIGMFAGEPDIDTPMSGPVRGRSAFLKYLEHERIWLLERQPGAEVLGVIETPSRIVAEYMIDLLREGERIEIPVATVADRTGELVSAVRVYHTTQRTRGMHVMRDPLIEPADTELPPLIRRYMAALEAADIEAMLVLFDEEAALREPNGTWHRGPEARRHYFENAFGGGGMRLLRCTSAFDEHRCAVEYVCDRWGGKDIDPQPGVAVYDISADGLLTAVRVYDDLKRPGEGE